MRNRARCKLCQSVIESFHSTDLVLCKCGEIFVEGGDALRCGASDWNNFLRVDDEGNEIVVVVKNKAEATINDETSREFVQSKPTKKDLLGMLDDMIANIEKLPIHAMSSPISHYDFVAALMLIGQILRTKK